MRVYIDSVRVRINHFCAHGGSRSKKKRLFKLIYILIYFQVTVIEEAVRYIDELHRALASRLTNAGTLKQKNNSHFIKDCFFLTLLAVTLFSYA